MMEIGISTYTYTWAVGVPGQHVSHPLSARDLIDRARHFDLTRLQIADNMPLHLLDAVELAALKKHADQQGVRVEVGTKRLDNPTLDSYLGIAKIFQSPFLRIVIDDGTYRPDTDRIIQILKDNMHAFEAEQIWLAIENHDRFKAGELARIIDAVGSPWLGICLDTVNSLGAGEDLYRVTETLGPHTVNFHVKEFTVKRASHKMGFAVEGVPFGQGMLPLFWILEQLHKDCFSAIVELWTPPEKTLDETVAKERRWAEISVKHLKEMMAAYEQRKIT